MSGGGEAPENSRYYDLIGVAKTASLEAIIDACRRIAEQNTLQQMLDKGLYRAACVLSDALLREIYDNYGERVMKQAISDDVLKRIYISERGEKDIVRDLFHSFYKQGRKFCLPKKEKAFVQLLPISLEEMFNGISKEISVELEQLCPGCKGSYAFEKCLTCKGSGIGNFRITHTHINSTMIMEHPCKLCKGFGDVESPGDGCRVCNSKRVVQTRKTFQFTVDKGMADGEQIIFPGQGNESPRSAPGDLIFVLTQTQHSVFFRNGDDLILVKKLSLVEAICGFKFTLINLDNKEIVIQSEPGEIIKPGQVKLIPNEGMFLKRWPLARGDLQVRFDIEFPEGLTAGRCNAWKSLLMSD